MKYFHIIFIKTFFVFQIICSLFNFDICYAQWMQTNGPVGGSNGICFINSGNNLFAGMKYGLYLSTNNGDNWVARNNGLVQNRHVQSFCISENKIFAGTGGGVFLSTNNGDSWNLAGSFGANSLATSGGNIFAGTNSEGVFLSTNNGGSWTEVNNGISSSNRHVYSIAITGNNIFAGTNGAIYQSTNNGGSWFNIGLTNLDIYSLAINGNNIYAGTYTGIFFSTNMGGSWTSGGLSNRHVYSIVSNDNSIFAGTDSGKIFVSSNSAVSWTAINNGISNSTSVYDLALSGNNLFAGIVDVSSGPYQNSYGGIYRSTNNGELWTVADLYCKIIFSLTVSNNNIFSGTENGVYMTTNNGENWTATSLSNKKITSFAVSGNNIFAATLDNGIYLTTNNGGSWSSVGLTNVYNINSLIISEGNLFAGGNGIYISTNNGANWANISNGINVYSLAAIGNNIFAATEGGVIRSTNNGANWAPTSLGGRIYSIATSESNVFAGADGVYLSTNNGSNWLAVNNGLNSNLRINSLCINGNNIFASNDSGIFLSSNNGGNWIKKNQGFNYIPLIISMCIGNDFIYSGAYGQSVWKRSLTEIIGIRNISTEIPSSFSLKQNYPNPFNPTTNIKFDVQKKASVKIVIYNSLGKEVSKLVNEEMNAGSYQIDWNAAEYPSGVYFCKLETYGYAQTKRMLLIK